MGRWRLMWAGSWVTAFAMSGAAADWSATPGTYAELETSKGKIVVRLFTDKAPKTAANFADLAEGKKEFVDPKTGETVRRPYYDGIIFHRVIDGFMIQGGDPTGTGRGGPGYDFADEINPGLNYEKGTLAMANRGPNTNGSQFFICLADQPGLPKNYTIFGKVVEGQSTVDAIGKVPVLGDRPTSPPVIKKVTIKRVS